MAEVREVGGVVDVGMAAAAAVLGVRGVLQLGMGEPVVVDPEEEHAGCGCARRRRIRLGDAGQVGDQRVVRVEDERAAAAPGAHHGRPAVGDRLQLPVAVELVAEEVAEQERARGELLDERPEPELVDLEQPDVAGHGAPAAARGGRERGGHAARHVRPGAVVDEARAGAVEHRRHHRGGGRLAVRRTDHHAALREAPGQQPDGVRLQPGEHLAGQRGPAAAARGADERADRLGGRHLRGEQVHGASTRSARWATRTVTGREATGSPSA